MNREDIIRMAREVGIEAEKDTLCRYEGWVEPLTRFAALVVANIDPSSFMSYQEGYEAGKQWLPKAYRDGDVGAEPKFTKYNMEVAFAAGAAAEREACAKVCDERDDDYGTFTAGECAEAIRKRSKQ